jgi:glycosyltransferase involved in cell wall biosynthesis
MSYSNPLISVILPVYNAEKYVSQAIESILTQTFQDFELILIEDGSTDQSPRILQSYQTEDERIRLVKNEANLGLISTLNKGIGIAKGKYIARMDADDICRPTRLEKQMKFLEKHPEIDVLGTGMEYIQEDGFELGWFEIHPKTPGAIRWILMFGNPFGHPTILLRKKAIDKVQGYSEQDRLVEDYALWTRMIQARNGANLDEPLVKYRLHPESVSTANQLEQQEKSHQISLQMLNLLLESSDANFLANTYLDRPLATQEDRLRTCRLILKLYRKLSARFRMPLRDKIEILQDVGKRIYGISATHQWNSPLFPYWFVTWIIRAGTRLLIKSPKSGIKDPSLRGRQ